MLYNYNSLFNPKRMEQVEQFTRLPELPRFTGESGAEPFVRKAQLLLQLQHVPPAYAVIWILDALEGRARQEVFDRAPEEINTPEKLLRFIIQRWGDQRDVTTLTQRSMREDLSDVADPAQPLTVPPPDLTFTQLTPHLLAYINQQVAAVEERLHLSIQQHRGDMDANGVHCPPAPRHPKLNKRKSRRRTTVCLWCNRKGHLEDDCRAKKSYVDHHTGTPHFFTTTDLPGNQEKEARGSEMSTPVQQTATLRSMTASPSSQNKDDRDRGTSHNTCNWQHTSRKPRSVGSDWSSRPLRDSENMDCCTVCHGRVKERVIKQRNTLNRRKSYCGFQIPDISTFSKTTYHADGLQRQLRSRESRKHKQVTTDAFLKESTPAKDSHKGPIWPRSERCRPEQNHLTTKTTVNSSTQTNNVLEEPIRPERPNMADLGHGYDGLIPLTTTHLDQYHGNTPTNQVTNKPEDTAPQRSRSWTGHGLHKAISASQAAKSLMLQSSNRDDEVIVISTGRRRDQQPDAGVDLPPPGVPRRSARIAQRAKTDT